MIEEHKSQVRVSSGITFFAFEWPTWYSCRVALFVLVNLASGSRPSRFLPACWTKFIAWCLRHPIRRMPIGSNYFSMHESWFVRDPHSGLMVIRRNIDFFDTIQLLLVPPYIFNFFSSFWEIQADCQLIILLCHLHGYSWPSLTTPPIVHRFWQVPRATSRILTELLYVGSSWSPCSWSAMWRGPQEYFPYELLTTSPSVSCMSGSSKLDSFRDGW